MSVPPFAGETYPMFSSSIFFSESPRAVPRDCASACYVTSPGKELKEIQVQVQVQNQPTQNIAVSVTLPSGFHYADGTYGKQVFHPDANGKINLQGLTCEAAVSNGQYWLLAEHSDGQAWAEIIVQADTIPTPGQAYETVFNSDGSRAYVNSAIDSDFTISIIDTKSQTIIASLDDVDSPSGIALSPDENHLYICHYFPNTLSVVDTRTLSTVGVLPLGVYPSNIFLHPNNALAYIKGENRILVVDLDRLRVVTTINTGNVNGLVFGPNSKAYALVFDAPFVESVVKVLDTRDHLVTRTLPLGGVASRIGISTDSLSVYVPIFTRGPFDPGSWIAVIDTLVDGFRNNIEHGEVGLVEFGVSPDGKRLYTANSTPFVFSIDLQSLAVKSIPLGNNIRPYYLSVSPDNTWIYGGDLGNDRLFALNVKE